MVVTPESTWLIPECAEYWPTLSPPDSWSSLRLTWCCHTGALVLRSPLIGSKQPSKFGMPRLETQVQHTSWSQSPAVTKPCSKFLEAGNLRWFSPSHSRLRGGNPISDSFIVNTTHTPSMVSTVAPTWSNITAQMAYINQQGLNSASHTSLHTINQIPKGKCRGSCVWPESTHTSIWYVTALTPPYPWYENFSYNGQPHNKSYNAYWQLLHTEDTGRVPCTWPLPYQMIAWVYTTMRHQSSNWQRRGTTQG